MQYYPKINTCFQRNLDRESPLYNCIVPDKFTQSEFELFSKHGIKWEATEKVDGECTSIHLIPDKKQVEYPPGEWTWMQDYKVEVHGKSDTSQMRIDEVEMLQRIGDKTKLVKAFSREVVPEEGPRVPFVQGPDVECIIFGETYGKGMQKAGNRYCKDKLKFICFDIRVGDLWLERDAVEDICKKLDIDTVPYLGEMSIQEAIDAVKKGFPSQVSEDPTLEAEGIVLRAPLGLLTRRGERLITKIKVKDFRDLEKKSMAYLKNLKP